MRLSSAYSSLLKLTKSSSIPRTLAFAVSRCLERSGFFSTFAIFSIGTPSSELQYSWNFSANARPIMSVRATSISLLCNPNSYNIHEGLSVSLISEMPATHEELILTLSRTHPPAILQDVSRLCSFFIHFVQSSRSVHTLSSTSVNLISMFAGTRARYVCTFLARGWKQLNLTRGREKRNRMGFVPLQTVRT